MMSNSQIQETRSHRISFVSLEVGLMIQQRGSKSFDENEG
uniref:Uncharacterized protein n=1 Tax=Arundo donax TaxID=35708 RepID=A0A0A9C062_ARUDO